MHVKETGNSSFLPSSHAALAYQRSLYDMDESIRVFFFSFKKSYQVYYLQSGPM